MEFILLIIAGIVVYYLYISLQDYLKKPLHQTILKNRQEEEYDLDNDPYNVLAQEDNQNKLFKTELGLMLMIIAQIPTRQKDLIEVILKDVSDKYLLHYPDFNAKENLNEFLKNPHSEENPSELAKLLLKMLYAEYKRRLQFVSFLLFIMFLDGRLDEKEMEFLLDVASELELDNADFNQVLDEFNLNFKEMQEIKDAQALKEAIQEEMFDLFDYKYQNKDIVQMAVKIYQNAAKRENEKD